MSARLTGRTRYREAWFGRLVLQVEERRTRLQPPLFVVTKTKIVWRDARCADFVPEHQAGLFTRAPIPYPGQPPTT